MTCQIATLVDKECLTHQTLMLTESDCDCITKDVGLYIHRISSVCYVACSNCMSSCALMYVHTTYVYTYATQYFTVYIQKHMHTYIDVRICILCMYIHSVLTYQLVTVSMLICMYIMWVYPV